MIHHISIARSIFVVCVLSANSCGIFSTKERGGKAEENDLSLAGEWNDSCQTADWFGITGSKQTLHFNAVGDYDRTTVIFKNNDCGAALTSLEQRGTYQALGKSSSAPDNNDLNFSVTFAQVTPLSAEAAETLNNEAYCGEKVWQKDKPVSVIGKQCMGKTVANGEVIFEVYRLSEDKKNLNFGKTSLWLDKSAADARPARLDEKHGFNKR